jgi:exosortase/archaeosortase family protein
LTIIIYLPHFLKNLLVSTMHWEEYINMPETMRVFNKIVVLEVLFFLIILFMLYNKEILLKIRIPGLNTRSSIIFALISYASVSYYYASQVFAVHYELFEGFLPILIVLSQFIALALFLIFAGITVFGTRYPVEIYRKTSPQPYYFGAALIILTICMSLFEKAWPFFSGNVSKILYFMLDKFYAVDMFLDNSVPVIMINDFAVSIGSPCSGIDSMLLFTAFFAGIFALDYNKLKKLNFTIFFIIGFLGVILVNILRLFLLIVIGVEFSPEFAVGMFHTNAGWILFIIYFLGYYWIIKKYIYQKTIQRISKNQ